MSPRPESITVTEYVGPSPPTGASPSTAGAIQEVEPVNREPEPRIRRRGEKFRAFMRMEKPLFGIEQITFSRVFLLVNHILAVPGLYFVLTGHFSWGVLLFQFVYSYLGALGTTIGAHRYWTHKAFKAKTPLRILLMCMQTITVQYSIYKWCLDHRIHHKYTDTNKDPHNAKRGFWFSHIFWVVTPKHPENEEMLKQFDMPDLEKDPIVVFQSKWYGPLVYFFYGWLPVNIVCYFWGLPRSQVLPLNCLRWVYNTHISAAVNSFAHMFGNRPYDESISSRDNKLVTLVSVGEGWHNYHHTFPWDYKASELGWKINFSTMIIDFFAWIGWAYDLKTVSQEMLIEKLRRSGDGSHPRAKKSPDEGLDDIDMANFKIDCDTTTTWGWGDEQISQELIQMTRILKPSRSRAYQNNNNNNLGEKDRNLDR